MLWKCKNDSKKMYVSEQLLYHYYYYLSIKSTQNGVPCNLTILIYMNDSSAQYAICIRSSYLLFFSFFHPSALVPTHKQIRVSGAHKHTTYIHTHTQKREQCFKVSVCLCASNFYSVDIIIDDICFVVGKQSSVVVFLS